MFAHTTHERPPLTHQDMRLFLVHGWGALGERLFQAWQAFNRQYFNAALQPVPLMVVKTSPYGHWLGLTCGMVTQRGVHRIELTFPDQGQHLVADRGVLLHEMVHQSLIETGQDPQHNGQPWCTAIMRLHQVITGARIWAAPDKVRKVDGRSVRLKDASPCGHPSLPQEVIAHWPTAAGLPLGPI